MRKSFKSLSRYIKIALPALLLPLLACAPKPPSNYCPAALWMPEGIILRLETVPDGTEEAKWLVDYYNQQNTLELLRSSH